MDSSQLLYPFGYCHQYKYAQSLIDNHMKKTGLSETKDGLEHKAC